MKYSIKCPCGRENVVEENCPVCGTDLTHIRKIQELEHKDKQNLVMDKKKKRIWAILGIITNLIIIIVLIISSYTNKSREKEVLAQTKNVPTKTVIQTTPVKTTPVKNTPTPTEKISDPKKIADDIKEAINAANIPFDIEVKLDNDRILINGVVSDKWIKDIVIYLANKQAQGLDVDNEGIIVDETIGRENIEDRYIEYIVVKGDTLSEIASKTLGSTTLWIKIYEDNKDIINDPSLIRAGQILKIYKEN